MTIRVTVREGALVPLDPLPLNWTEGRELELQELDDNSTAEPNLPFDSEDDSVWLDDEEYQRFVEAIAEIRREGKEQMRRQMGLD
jgi:hypothetical protein